MTSQSEEITVTPLDEGRSRLDVYLSRALAGVSRSKAQEMIESGLVFVNGQPASSKFQVKAGDVIRFQMLAPTATQLEPVAMALDILFEDESVLVINKPAGIAVHPGAGEKGATLVHGLLYHCKKLGSGQTDEDEDSEVRDRPGIVLQTASSIRSRCRRARLKINRSKHTKSVRIPLWWPTPRSILVSILAKSRPELFRL